MMKRVFKKAISVFLVVVMVLGAAPLTSMVGLDMPELNLFATKVNAMEKSGHYTYNISEDEATIVIVDASLSGDISIPSELDGYPVTRIVDRAFEGCTGITGVTIPDTVTSMGKDTLSYCTSLKSVTVDSENTVYSSDEYGVLFNKDKTELILFPTGNATKNYTIPDSVTVVSQNAFKGCKDLTSITIGSGVTNLGDDVFLMCSSLESITVDSENTVYSSDEYGVLFNKDKTELILYPVGNTTKSYTIPDSVETICDYAFEGCKALASLTIGSKATNLGDDVFFMCEGLANITVDPENTVYSSDADGVLFNKDKTVLIQYPIGNARTSYTVPYTVTKIGYAAFYYCSSLTSIVVYNGLTRIEGSAFRYCYNLRNVYYTGTEDQWDDISIASDNTYLMDANVQCGYEVPCEHSYVSTIITPATCEDDGVKKSDCTKCGKSYTETIAATGHTAGNWEVIVEATDETEGEKVKKCTTCGKVVETRTIPVGGDKGKVHSVSVSDISLDYKGSKTITPTINVDEDVSYTVNYRSSDESIVTVDDDGNISSPGVKGSAKITVIVTDQYGNTVTDTCKVTVKYSVWQWIIVIFFFGWIWY